MSEVNRNLICLVNGAPFDNVFKIEIPQDQLIIDLKKRIKEEAEIQSPYMYLTLWGVSIPFGDTVILEELKLEEDLPKIRKLSPLDTVAESFPDLARKHVHIIVEVPAEVNLKRKSEVDVSTQIQDLVQELEALREDRKVALSISRITGQRFQQLLAEWGLRRETVVLNIPSKRVAPFVWGRDKEDAHTDQYLKWLERHITVPGDVEFYCASKHQNFLSTTLASSQFNLNGTLDVVVVDSAYVKDNNIPAGVRVGLELKKTVDANDYMQVIAELMAANIVSRYRVVIILTDLKSHWQFFWLAPAVVMSCTLDRSSAVPFLEILAADTDTDTGVPSGADSADDPPYRGRCGIRDLLNLGEGTGAKDRGAGGLESVLKRPKLDVFEMLPKSDIADMREVFDTMSSEEIRDWKTKKVMQSLMGTPAIQSSIIGDEWQRMYT